MHNIIIYILYSWNNSSLHSLADGKSIENALDEMLYAENVNVIDSTIKAYIDAWYQENLLNFSIYLEDTVFCNNRNIVTLNGWNPNGGNTEGDLLFKEGNASNDLNCTNETDRFSTKNEKAKLTYPVGLVSQPEVNILNNSNIQKSGQPYWLLSPSDYILGSAHGRYVYFTGELKGENVHYSNDVRPVISLKPGIEYSDGDGSREHPYIIDMEGD